MLEIYDHGAVRELRLARPPANALDPALIAALRRSVGEAAAGGARGLVLSGAPGFFTGGLDVPALLPLDRAAIRAAWQDFFVLLGELATSPIPVVAAITGHSPAGGCVLSLFADYRVMAEGPFKIGLNEVAVGIAMPAALHAAAVHVVGARWAERMCTTGELYTAEQARAIGLVDELVPVGEVVARAVGWCDGLLRLPPEALRKTRQVGRAGLVAALRAGGPDHLDALVDAWFSAETQATLAGVVARLTAKRG
jgi:3,2-trans-enoyl-CoA isomerase